MTHTAVETEAYYDILANADGELLFCLKAREGSPDRPQILFNGENHALFYRTADQMIVLDYIHPEVCPLLKEASSVLVAEFTEPGGDNPMKGIFVPPSFSVAFNSNLSVICFIPSSSV